MSKRALVRPPGPRLADGLVTHIDRSPIDLDLARRQWEGYVAALEAERFNLWKMRCAAEVAKCPLT